MLSNDATQLSAGHTAHSRGDNCCCMQSCVAGQIIKSSCLCGPALLQLQGLAAGLMLSISLIDLLPEAVEEIGFIPANLCFYAGVLFFALIVAVIPEPHAVAASEQPHVAPQQHAANGSLSSSSDPPDLAACRQSKLPGHQSTAHAAGAEGTPGTQGGLRHRSNIAQPEAAEAAAASISPAAAALCTPSRGCTLTASGKLGKPPQQQQQPAGQLSPQSPVSSQATSTDLQVLLQEDAPSRDISRRNSSKQEDNTCVKQQLLMSGLITAVGIGRWLEIKGHRVSVHSRPCIPVGLAV